MLKKVLSVILSAAMLFAVSAVGAAAAEGANTVTGNLNVISFNVDGLPVPSFISSSGRNPVEATKLIAKEVNARNCDILCAQEDFDFHAILKNRLELPYATLSSGGTGIGDGLSIFSKHPIYNVKRVPWEKAHGIFNHGSDELTPKGILYSSVEIADGIFVDVYNIHADAWEDEESMLAKAAQFDQLAKLVEEQSEGRPVIITGDFNVNYALFREGYQNGAYKVDLSGKIIENFIDKGFKDAWVEKQAGGNYYFTQNEMYEKYGCPYMRTWDTLDHILFRDGDGVAFELVSAEYDAMGEPQDNSWNGVVSDHVAVKASFKYTADMDKITPVGEKITEEYSFIDSVKNFLEGFWHLLKTVIINLPQLIKDGFEFIK